jgi:regulator of sirC expression with transglutaminase-like and TPR domain
VTDALERFARLVERDPIPLDAACAAIGAHLDPAPDALAVPERLDEIAAAVPGATVEDLTGHLFGTLGLHGDAETYDDPENSFLHRVLERRRGLPITLSIITIEVGRRIGLDLVGVGMPGHFLVQDRGAPDRFLDPFIGGQVLARDDCVERFHRLFGRTAAFTDDYLRPTPAIDIVTRVLANLRATYSRRESRRPLAETLRLRSLVPPRRPAEDRELAGALEAIGAFDEAATTYERAAAGADEADRARLEARAHRLRARLN